MFCPECIEIRETGNKECVNCGTRKIHSSSKLLDASSEKGIVPETRQTQIKMARKVEAGLINGDINIIEAGVGTGKTFAYTVPAIQLSNKVLISTATKNLQDQLLNQDLPYLSEKFQELGENKWVIGKLKGKSNYFCPRKATKHMDNDQYDVFEDILKTNPTFEYHELPDKLEEQIPGRKDAQGCIGKEKCQYSNICPYMNAKLKSKSSDVVVTNHAYIAYNLKYNKQFLDDYDTLIIDEAHRFDKYFKKAYSGVIDPERIINEWKDHVRTSRGKKIAHKIEEVCQDYQQKLNRISDLIEDQSSNYKPPHKIPNQIFKANLLGPTKKLLECFGNQLNSYKEFVDIDTEAESDGHTAQKDKEFCTQMERTGSTIKTLKEKYDANYVVPTLKQNNDGPYHIGLEPMASGPILKKKAFANDINLVFTSATLQHKDKFSAFKSDLFINSLSEQSNRSVNEVSLGSIYDYNDQCQVYVEKDKAYIPKTPSQSNNQLYKEYADNLSKRIIRVLKKSDGNAFVLFSNYRDLKAVDARINRSQKLIHKTPSKGLHIDKVPSHWSIITQTFNDNVDSLTQEFMMYDNAVLLATKSFWHGVSIEGSDLLQVVIPKVPFSPPDPARDQKAKLFNTHPFECNRREMTVDLKQGVGRLIRSQTDRGIISILDARIAHKNWGPKTLKQLEVTDDNIITDISDIQEVT